jgi:hypothetical protein
MWSDRKQRLFMDRIQDVLSSNGLAPEQVHLLRPPRASSCSRAPLPI